MEPLHHVKSFTSPAPVAPLSRKRSAPGSLLNFDNIRPCTNDLGLGTSVSSANIVPIAEENDEYGFYCDENGDSGDGAAVPFAIATAGGVGRRDHFGASFASSSSSSSFAFSSNGAIASQDPISHIHKASSPGFHPFDFSQQASLSSEGSFGFGGGGGGGGVVSSESGLNLAHKEHLAMEEEEVPVEAPVWVVSQGPAKTCERCSRRTVYSARDNTPGRVFSRSFRSANSSLSSGSRTSLSSFNSSFGSSSGSLGGGLRRMSSVLSRDESAQSLSSFETFETPTAAAMGGFRVVSGWFPGQEWAEFEIVVSTGSAVYRAWRTHADFARLVETVGVRRKYRTMGKANLAWEMVQRVTKWIGGCDMLHLIRKRHCLDIFVENLLYELDSPAQFLNFVDDATWCPEQSACSCRSGHNTQAQQDQHQQKQHQQQTAATSSGGDLMSQTAQV